jgi:hypothetical protein
MIDLYDRLEEKKDVLLKEISLKFLRKENRTNVAHGLDYLLAIARR